MINGTITKHGTGKTHQPGLRFFAKRKIFISSGRTVDEDLPGVPDTGLSVCSSGQRAQVRNDYPGSLSSIYFEDSSNLDCQDKKVCKFYRNVYQQSGQCCAGRIFSKDRSWPKERGKLKYHFPTTGCGSKNSLRFTIYLFQQITRLFQLTTAVPIN
jgi:hypothetical protein